MEAFFFVTSDQTRYPMQSTPDSRMKRFIRFLETGYGFFSILVITIGLWFGCWYLLSSGKFVKPPQEAGTFGDMFGAVNALFGGITVAGVFYGILLTRRQLIEAKEDSRVQHFEGTLFNMLNMLNEIVTNMEGQTKLQHKNGDDQFRGRNYLKHAVMDLHSEHLANYSYKYNHISHDFTKFLNPLPGDLEGKPTPTDKRLSFDQLREAIDYEYNKFFEHHHAYLGHYFRYVYNIIKFIVKECPPSENPNHFLGMLQAQLSNAELALLFYNALSRHGRKKNGEDQLRQWLDDYSMLENLSSSDLFDKDNIHFYPKTKFKFMFQEQANQNE